MTSSESPKRGVLDVWLVSLMFLLLGAGIVLYGRRDWLPALASRHGAGIDDMLHYLLFTTGSLLFVAFTALSWLVWTGGRRNAVTQRVAAARTEIVISLLLGMLMAAVAEGGVLAIGMPVWKEYFEAAPPPGAVEIDVTAQQFFWNVRYPGPDGVFGRVRNELVDEASNPLGLDSADAKGADDIYLVNQFIVAVDRPVHIRLHSKDMIHSFFLPHLRVKQDVIPGMTPEITFVPTREGTYELACAELCGLAHYRMQGLFKVVAQRDYERALREEASK
jgi:cytochrome c oxidase subunit 2